MEVLIENGALMIENAEISTLFVEDDGEIYFNGWVNTGEPEPDDWMCVSIFEGKLNYKE